MLAYVPAQWIASTLGGEGAALILTATFVGVPAYLNGYAALPLIAGLVEQGAPGVGLAFLVAGVVTSLPAAIAVFALGIHLIRLAAPSASGGWVPLCQPAGNS